MIVKEKGYHEYIPQSSIITVTDLNQKIKSLLQTSQLQDIWIKGEISNLRTTNKTTFFTIKDERSEIQCLTFKDIQKGDLQDGDKITLQGDITYYRQKGTVNIRVKKIRKEGNGKLHKKLKQRKRKLKQQGFFDKQVKQEIPSHITNIGLVTSKEADAKNDFLHTIKRRYPHLTITIHYSSVQGEQAPTQLQQAIESLQDTDVIAIVRGGGTIEDLWCFNNPNLLTTVKESNTPITTGLGHENDETLTDLTANHASSTPTSLAEQLTPNESVYRKKLELLQTSLTHQFQTSIRTCRQQLQRKEETLHKTMFQSLEQTSQEIEEIERSLEQHHPTNLLEQGFAQVRKNQTLIRDGKNLSEGDTIEIRFNDKAVKAEVKPDEHETKNTEN